jgi:long-chain fatty acid transport protein
VRNEWTAALLALCLTSGSARAGGFFDATQSASSAGNAGAGATALAEDASTIFYNPAGLALINASEVVTASGFSFVGQDVANGSGRDAVGLPITGNTGTNPQIVVQPSLFFAYPLDTRLHLGLGVFAPFGQSMKYSDSWIGRYQVQQVSLETIDVRPALSYQLLNWLSVGASLDIVYADFKRSNAIDFGSICFAQFSPARCGLLGLAPGNADGRLVANGTDWGVGYDFGVLVQPTPWLRFGLNYRSALRNPLSGSAQFNVPAAALPLTAGGAFQNTTVQANLPFPAVISAGLAYDATDRWTVLLDLSWTNWNALKALSDTFGNATPVSYQPLNWHNSWRGAVGADYRISDPLLLRIGFAFDQTPVPSQFRTADLPQSDGITVAVGATYQIASWLKLTGSYAYSHWSAAQFSYSTPAGGTLSATERQDSHSLGLQTVLNF